MRSGFPCGLAGIFSLTVGLNEAQVKRYIEWPRKEDNRKNPFNILFNISNHYTTTVV